MMMAHDSSSGSNRLAQTTLDTLRVALTAYIDAPSDGEPLRAALHAIADEAREKSIMPEGLLLALKDTWFALPAVRAMRESADQTRLLQRVVTMCIKEYYA